MQAPDFTFQQLSNNAKNIPGDMIFSTLTWFGAAGAAVTFTATPPPGAPTFMAPPSIWSGGEPSQEPGPPLYPHPWAAPRAPPPIAVFSPPLFPSTLLLSSGGGGSSGRAAWQIGLVLGLVVGVVLLLGLLATLLWKRQLCCWGHRRDGGMYKTKVRGLAERRGGLFHSPAAATL